MIEAPCSLSIFICRFWQRKDFGGNPPIWNYQLYIRVRVSHPLHIRDRFANSAVDAPQTFGVYFTCSPISPSPILLANPIY
jgi:hypothetical protein